MSTGPATSSGTEGWTAGVRLSAMRMEDTESPSDFVSELALDVGSIGEYLVNEVIRRQPEPFRRLLIETSFLDEVTGPLADAITGMTGCGDMLTDLARSNSFVIPLDAAQARTAQPVTGSLGRVPRPGAGIDPEDRGSVPRFLFIDVGLGDQG